MVDQTPWIEREFGSRPPIGLHPIVVARLRGAPARIGELTRELSPSVLTLRPESGGWSIQEHAGHLLDLEPLWRKRLDEILAHAEVLTAADISNRRTDEARHNDAPISAIIEEFRRARLALVRALAGLTEVEIARSSLHPRLRQPMRVIDLALVVAEHDDHHIARMHTLADRLASVAGN